MLLASEKFGNRFKGNSTSEYNFNTDDWRSYYVSASFHSTSDFSKLNSAETGSLTSSPSSQRMESV